MNFCCLFYFVNIIRRKKLSIIWIFNNMLNMERKKVLFTTNVPSPYRVDFFNELGKYVDLVVFFEKNTSTERDCSWENYSFVNFKGVILDGKETSVDSAYCPSIVDEFKKYTFDYIFICNYFSKTGFKLISYLIKKIIKKFIFSHARMCLSTSIENDNYFLSNGVKKNNIRRYPFSSIFENEIIDFSRKKELNKLYKDELLLNDGTINIVSVGQFIYRKGFDLLIKSLKRLNLNYKLYVIGGEPTEEYIQLVKLNDLDDRVIFIGYQPKNVILKYLISADIFITPTREDIWG